MKTLFETCTVGAIDIKNRIIRSATHEGTAIDGMVSDTFVELYEELSKGNIGLIITGYATVSGTDHAGPTTIALTHDSVIEGLTHITKIAHEQGTKIVAQLNHQSSSLWSAPEGPVFGPSAVTDPVSGITPEPFTTEQVRMLINEFADAAVRAKKAGFDGVQIHGAHGYLFSKWLSPRYNKRTDEYGGSLANNARVIVETLKAIKDKCGKAYPVWIKLNCSDFDPEDDGVTEEIFLTTANILTEHGIDAIEVSGGSQVGRYAPSRPRKFSAYHRESAEKLTGMVDASVVLVGGVRSLDLAEEILTNTEIEAISLCRPLIREPQLVKRWAEGDRNDAACVACNGCFNPNGTKCFFTLNDAEKEAQKNIMRMLAKIKPA